MIVTGLTATTKSLPKKCFFYNSGGDEYVAFFTGGHPYVLFTE